MRRRIARISIIFVKPQIVLTSSILADRRSTAVPELELETLNVPVLVVHHEEDGCRVCLFSDMPRLMEKLADLDAAPPANS